MLRSDVSTTPPPAASYFSDGPCTSESAPEPEGRKDFKVAWEAMQHWRYAVCA